MNGLRADNRPQNLELWVIPQPPGQRARDLAYWLRENYCADWEAAVERTRHELELESCDYEDVELRKQLHERVFN